MSYSYYVFALFLFLLFCLSVQFSVKKKAGILKQKEQKLLQLYGNLEEMMDDLENYAQTAKTEMVEGKAQVSQMLSEMEQMKKQLKHREQEPQAQQPPKKRGRPRKYPVPNELQVKPAKPALVKTKQQRVRELMAQGLKEDGIARALGISRGEVSLIAGMIRQA